MISLSGRSIQSELPYNQKKKCLKMAKADLQNGQFVWCPDPSMLCPRLELSLLKGDFTKNVYLKLLILTFYNNC